MKISKRGAKERWRSSTSKRNNNLQLLNKLQCHLLSNTACTTGKECSHTLAAATTARGARFCGWQEANPFEELPYLSYHENVVSHLDVRWHLWGHYLSGTLLTWVEFTRTRGKVTSLAEESNTSVRKAGGFLRCCWTSQRDTRPCTRSCECGHAFRD